MSRQLPSCRQELRRDIDARHLRARAGDVARRPTRAGGKVEHLLLRLRAQPLRGVRQGIGNPEADVVVGFSALPPNRSCCLVMREHALIEGIGLHRILLCLPTNYYEKRNVLRPNRGGVPAWLRTVAGSSEGEPTPPGGAFFVGENPRCLLRVVTGFPEAPRQVILAKPRRETLPQIRISLHGL